MCFDGGVDRPERSLQGALVALRLPCGEDASTLFGYASRVGGVEGIWVPITSRTTLERCDALVADWLAGWRGDASDHGPAFVVTAADDPRLVGYVGLRNRGEGVVELVYGIAPDWRRRGFATEAACLVSEWLLTRQGAAVELRIGADHVASQRVATNAGFRVSGTVRSIGPSGETYADVRYVFHGG